MRGPGPAPDRGGRAHPLRPRRLLRGVLAVRPRPHPARARAHPDRGRRRHHPARCRPRAASPADRSLRPLAGVSRAAVAIAGGRLDTRLGSEAADPDLEGLTTSFNAMVDQLQARIEREARFNSDVSHELRSPLTTLSASLEVLEAGPRQPAAPGPARPAAAGRRPAPVPAHGRRPARDVPGRRRLGRCLPRRGQRRANWCSGRSRPACASLGDGGSHARGGDRRRTCGSLHVGVDKRRFERVMANLLENAANYGGGATCVMRGRAGHRPRWSRRSDDGAAGGGAAEAGCGCGPRPRRGLAGPRTSRSRSKTPGRASTPWSGPRCSSASTGGRPRDGGARARVPDSAWPWWPSTCA